MKPRDSIRSAILRTLLYAKIFDAGVRETDLAHLLISPRNFSGPEITRGLGLFSHQRTITRESGWLRWGSVASTAVMQKRWQVSIEKKKLLRRYIPLIGWIPSVRAIAITGSVAIGNAKSEEDIDLMIVVRRGFLWVTRALVGTILWSAGRLRTQHTKKNQNKFCLNLWLDDSSLALPNHSLYVARELAQAEWVLDREKVAVRIIAANHWTQKFMRLPTPRIPPSITSPSLCSRWASPLETAAFYLQTFHMKNRTREIVLKHSAFFHPRNTQGDVLKKYAALCRRFKIDSLMR